MSKTALLFSLALREIGSELEYLAIFTPARNGSYPKSSVQDELKRMQKQLSTVYVVLYSSETLALSLFHEATELGMMEKGYVWICGNDITSLLDSTFNSSFISNYMQGVLGIESYINESTPNYQKFYSEFQQTFKKEYENNSEIVFTPGVYAFRAYDIVQAITLAAVKSEKNNMPLVENLIASNFTGFSKGLPIENELGLHGPSLNNLTVVFWPGGPTIIPGGLRRLKVGIPANPVFENFQMVEVDIETRSVTNPRGFCIDVYLAVLDKMNYKFEYEYVPFNLGINASLDYEFQPIPQGTNSSNEFTYDDLVNQVYLEKVDLVVGDVTILAPRSEKVSFTQPFLSSGIVMLVPLEHDNSRWLLLSPFKWTLWLGIGGMMLCIFVAIWVLEKYDNKADDDFRGPWYKQISAALWVIGNTIFLSYGDGKIGSYYTKTVIICWLMVVLILSSSYTANLSSILVIENLKPRVDESRISCSGLGFLFNYLKDVLHYTQDIVLVTNSSDYPNAFQNGTITAAFLEVPYVRVFLSEYKGYTVYGETHMLGGFGFVLPKFSTMTLDMSKAILELEEDGTLKKIEDKWFSVSFKPAVSPMENTKKKTLEFDSFLGLFVSCLVVSVSVVLIFLCRKKKNNKTRPHSENKDRRTKLILNEQGEIECVNLLGENEPRNFTEIRSISLPK
ncbi:hypothetical protein LUZ60_000717 [Juncus effusus]|nr:hypothetical protein LUZ60_000717 [Juncus effusus]